jgi:hypothetical protein
MIPWAHARLVRVHVWRLRNERQCGSVEWLQLASGTWIKLHIVLRDMGTPMSRYAFSRRF